MRGLVLAVAALAPPLTANAAPPAPPNILVVLVDDLGFSDLGCYGSEIPTPNLDRLAAAGVRFTQFSNTAKCHSSRVSLLSGLYCRQAGDVELTRAVIIPEMLGPAGYFTAMTGKWHLSREPTDFGFDRYFGHLSGATDYYRGNSSFRLNGRPWTVPEQGFYTTVADVDYALDFLAEARATRKPWFLYVAFNAPHGPLQPLEADYKKHLGRYDVGWDVIRAARVAKQREIGLFGRDVEPSPRPDHVPAWDALPPETQAWESRRMAAYAALIDRVDQELGRLFADLERAGEFENTFVLFLSDNGACPYDRRTVGRDREPYEPGVAWSDSTGWAWARNTPFRYYKQNQFEGGIATPAIVHWPAGIPPLDRAANEATGDHQGRLVHTPAHLIDVLPTLAEIAGTKRPDTWPGREVEPLAGVSLVPLFNGGELEQRPPIHLLFSLDRGLRDGDWKLVSFKQEPWELYNLAADRTELHDLAAEHPEIVARMAKQWTDMARDVLRCPPREIADVAEAATVPRQNPQWTDYSSPDSSAARHAARKGKAARQRAEERAAKARP
jgi:arylsulfatase A-like enzyme